MIVRAQMYIFSRQSLVYKFSENGPQKVIGANLLPSYLRAQEELGEKPGI